MANTIKIKRSSVPGKVPAAGELDFGELAINYADGNLFFKDSTNSVATIASTEFVSVTGNVTAQNFIGNGALLTGVTSTATPGGNTGEVQFNNSGVTDGSANFTFDGTNVTVVGNISGNLFIGNGSLLTGIDATSIQNGSSNVRVVASDGNVSVGINGSSNVAVFSAAGLDVAGNISSNSITSNNISGTILTNSQPNITSVGTLANLLVTGNVGVGTTTPAAKIEVNIAAADTALTAARLNLNAAASASETIPVTNPSLELRRGSMGRGTFVKFINQRPGFAGIGSTADEDNGHDLRFHTGDGTARMFIDSAGTVSATGNITSGNFVGTLNGSGANITSINASNISSGTLAQTRLANAAVTLGSTALTLGATVTTVTGLSSVTSTTFVGALTGAATTAGTVTTAAQPNITSVGTLTSLAVTGNTTSGNFIGTLNGSGANVTSINATNIASGTLAVARGGTGVTTSTGTGAVVLGTSPTFTTQITVPSIVKSGTNAVGNIGQTDNRFNNVFARASSASYADLAEKYLTDSAYPAGTVVVFGGEKEVTESDQYADSRLAGVISTNPAFVMNDDAEGQPVALQGRVPCSVVGNIVKGDLITTSDVPGVATRLDPEDWRPGSVLGKALENYNSTEPGVIEVVVGRV
jgi:hypothetical protein